MSEQWAEVAMVVALVLPLAGLVPVLVLAGDATQWARIGAILSAALWVVILVAGHRPEVGALRPDQLAAAAAAGAALVAAAVAGPWSGAAATAVALGLVATKGSSLDPGALVSAMAAAVVLAAAAPRSTGERTDPVRTSLAAISIVALAAGVHVGATSTGLLLVSVGAALVVAVAGFSVGPVAVVLAGGLAAGLRWLPVLDQADHRAWAGTGLALAAAVAAVLPFAVRRLATLGPAVPLALWSLAAATDVGGTRPAAGLLAVAAVLSVVLGGQASALFALPGAAVLAHALTDAGGGREAVVAVAAVVTLGALATSRPTVVSGVASVRDAVVRNPVAVPAIAAGLWLVLMPSAWRWARPGDVAAYEEGVAVAVAAAVAVCALLLAAGAPPPDIRGLFGRQEPLPATTPRCRVAGIVVAAALAIVAAALVRSSGFTASS
jgi:hypothetical protein